MAKNKNNITPPAKQKPKGKQVNPPSKSAKIADKGPGWPVEKHENGLRLTNFIQQRLSKESVSLRQIKSLLEKGACRVNGKIEKFASRKVKLGEKISFQYDQKVITEKAEKIELSRDQIVFEDNHFIAVDKPAGTPCGPTDLEDQNNLKVYLEEFLHIKLEMIHRLDKETSGVILYAKSEKVQKAFVDIFKNRKIQKIYTALIDGMLHEAEGLIDKRMVLKKKGRGWERWAVTQGQMGKEAHTIFKRIKVITRQATLVEVKPITGRTHQIRVHMKSIGHPVLGDYFYNREFACPIPFAFQLLHASSVELTHPITNRKILIETPMPKRFVEAISKLQKLEEKN